MGREIEMFKSFKNKDSVGKRLDALEGEIFPEEEKKIHDFWFPSFFYSQLTRPLKKQVEDLKEELAKNEKLVKMILDNMKLEYVKITEENGSRETREILRKKKHIKKKKVEVDDDEE
jgi:hypothetical protein